MKILTKEDREVIIRFQKYTFKESWKKMLSLSWLIILLIIIFIMLNQYYITGLIVVTYLVLIISLPITNKILTNSLNKSSKLMMESKVCEYEFNDDRFIVNAYQNDELIAMNKYKYEQIFRVEESKDDVYIFIANNIAFCIDKSDADGKDIDELRGILQSKVSNYKINIKGANNK